MGNASRTLATAGLWMRPVTVRLLGAQQFLRHPLSMTGGQTGIQVESHIMSMYRARYRRAEEGLRYAAQAHPSERQMHNGNAEVLAQPHGCFFTPQSGRLCALLAQAGSPTHNSRRPT